MIYDFDFLENWLRLYKKDFFSASDVFLTRKQGVSVEDTLTPVAAKMPINFSFLFNTSEYELTL
jgi:hypothetical protein